MIRHDITIDNSTSLSPWRQGGKKLSLAIGFFDGVHHGHQKVIAQAVHYARKHQLEAAVMTFDPHPRTLVGADLQYNYVLTPLADKMKLFAQLGVEQVWVIHFNEQFSRLLATTFINRMIIPLGVEAVSVGFDFRFGYHGEGNIDTLKNEAHLKVLVVDPLFLQNQKISSTRIRQNLAKGQCENVSLQLNRLYTIKGIIEPGDQRGRQLGFPTANVHLDDSYYLPRNGVYAVHVDLLDTQNQVKQKCQGILNIGVRPTFTASSKELKIEVYLRNFSGNLYGRQVAIHFQKFLRPEKKFTSIEALQQQIRSDVHAAWQCLEKERL